MPFQNKKEQKNQLDINDHFSWSRKKHGSFWRKRCQYWLIAPLEITVTESINIWTLTPQLTQKLGSERKYSTCYWNAASLKWSKHSSYLEFTETLYSHLGQEAIPPNPAETIHACFLVFFFVFQKPKVVSWVQTESTAGLISGWSIRIPKGNPKSGHVGRGRVETKWWDILRLENCKWLEFKQE